LPGGIGTGVGMGGHVTGGGFGPLSRLYGQMSDHLYAVETVVVDENGKAKAVTATREEDDPHRDLWWAHTDGGGGNFGVATKFWFRSRDGSRRWSTTICAGVNGTVRPGVRGHPCMATWSWSARNSAW
jgi:FAD/FMN-containing dehydrogenase